MPTFIGNSISSVNLQQESHSFRVGNADIMELTSAGIDMKTLPVANVGAPVNATDAANKNYVDVAISGLVDGAGASLDTLKELGQALGDDADFSNTVIGLINQKVSSADFNSLFAARLVAEDLATSTYVNAQIAANNQNLTDLSDSLTRYQWMQAQFASLATDVVVFQNSLQPVGNAAKKIVLGGASKEFTVQPGLYCVRMNLACTYAGDNDVPARMLMVDAVDSSIMQLKGSRAIDNTNVVSNETSLVVQVLTQQIYRFKIVDAGQATVESDTRVTFEQL